MRATQMGIELANRGSWKDSFAKPSLFVKTSPGWPAFAGHDRLGQFPEWPVLCKFFDLLGHGFTLTLEIVVHRAAQAGMGDVVRTVGRRGQIPTQELVFALCAGFDLAQSARNGEFD